MAGSVPPNPAQPINPAIAAATLKDIAATAGSPAATAATSTTTPANAPGATPVNPPGGLAPGGPGGPGSGPGGPAAGSGTAITLAPGGPAVVNTSPNVAVTVGGTPPAPGSVLTFTLVVTDDLGTTSAPAKVSVTVRGAPTATVSGPAAVPTGATIPLAGIGTPQGGGKIVSFAWQLSSVTNPVT